MLLNDLQAALPVGILLSILLGPIFFILLETAATKGFRAAFALDLGVVVADACFIALAYLSTNQLLEKIKDDPALFIFGGSLLVAYGIISLVKDKKNLKSKNLVTVDLVKKQNYLTFFVKGFFLNFINIGVLGFWLTVIITVGPQLNMDRQRIILFFTLVLVIYLIIDVFKILLAKTLMQQINGTTYLLFKNLC